MIWSLALPEGRIVKLRMMPLKMTLREWQNKKLLELPWPAECLEIDFTVLLREDAPHGLRFSWLLNDVSPAYAFALGRTRILGNDIVAAWRNDYKGLVRGGLDEEALNAPLLGLKSSSQPPALLFTCVESFEVAKNYERAFTCSALDAAFPETWFNFKEDIIYLRLDTESSLSHYESAERILRYTKMERVQNLALFVDLSQRDSLSAFEDIVGWISLSASSIKRLIIVTDNCAASFEHENIAFIDPSYYNTILDMYNQGIRKPNIHLHLPAIATDYPLITDLSARIKGRRQKGLESVRRLDMLSLEHLFLSFNPEIEFRQAVTTDVRDLLERLRKSFEKNPVKAKLDWDQFLAVEAEVDIMCNSFANLNINI